MTTSPEARVGRFSVSRAQETSLDSSQTAPPAAPPTAPASRRPNDLGHTLSPDPAQKASLPNLNNNSFNNSYFSSDNDSEFEDEDFKREVSLLREKQVASCSLFFSQCHWFKRLVYRLPFFLSVPKIIDLCPFFNDCYISTFRSRIKSLLRILIYYLIIFLFLFLSYHLHFLSFLILFLICFISSSQSGT